jgi:hypothetical protein
MGGAAAVLATMSSAGGCAKALFLMSDEKLKPVPAECDKLKGRRVAVVVWADPSTLDLDPFAGVRAAQQILYFLQLNRGRKELEGATFMDAPTVARVQEQLGSAGPLTQDAQVGEKLGADVVVRVDLFEYTTRAPEANGLIKGRVSGNLAVWPADATDAIYRAEVSAEFPEGTRIGVLDRGDEDVLNETLRIFGERVARKFHAHEVKYE